MGKVLILTVCLMCSAGVYAQKLDTFRLYFSLNDNKVNKRNCKYMDSLLAKKALKHGQKLTVLGYADYVGSNGYNDTLSLIRAQHVANYLMQKGLDSADLALCTGKGKIDRAPVNGKSGYAEDRNVQIITGWIKKPATEGSGLTNIDTSKIIVNAAYPLNILFENARSVILPESMPVMQQLYDFVNNNKTLVIQIEGHICCLDPRLGVADGHDMDDGGRLSVNRARAIYNYLVAHGIDKKRLKYIGLGNTRPWVNPETNEEDKKKNRRVEIRILSK